jgi:XTP/dITP diphosphohydrolase
MSQQLILASNNTGKIREFSELLGPLGFDVVPQSQFKIEAADEPFATFVENALAKARHVSAACGLAALADDSGICVQALGGEPGVHSARYAGPECNDEANNQKLITQLQNQENRAAHYVSALVMVQSAYDPEPLIVQTRWHGEIIESPRGPHGFGYDPHFLIKELGKTAAELEPAQKNQISHRGQALHELIRQLNIRA